MRNLRFVFLAATLAALAFASLDSAAFAMAAGGGGGAGAGGAGGAGAGSNPTEGQSTAVRVVLRHKAYHAAVRQSASCHKQEQLYDRHGFAVVDLHSAHCFK